LKLNYPNIEKFNGKAVIEKLLYSNIISCHIYSINCLKHVWLSYYFYGESYYLLLLCVGLLDTTSWHNNKAPTSYAQVDERYSQCLDEIHTVISAFHAATELDPQIHTRFSLQTISFLYKRLRERISNQILAMGAHLDSGDTIETGGSFGTSYLQKQWTLQQLKKNDHQLWRPQRGLPERSVSVLRAWMFQNFLHP
jgi:hypothetical protein